MATRQVNASDFDFPIDVNSLKLYRTLKDAQKAASSIGWLQDSVIKLNKRFEHGYLVAQWFMEGEDICGIQFDAFITPLYEYGDNYGIKFMKTIKAVARTAR
jgi:hypothetical protein